MVQRQRQLHPPATPEIELAQEEVAPQAGLSVRLTLQGGTSLRKGDLDRGMRVADLVPPDTLKQLGVRDPAARITNLGLIAPTGASVGDEGDDVGSLVGWLAEGVVSDCYARGVRVSGGDRVGGLVGTNCGTLRQCCVTGSVSGERSVGGLVGRCGRYTRALRRVASVSTAGAISGEVVNCCAVGVVLGLDKAGGLVGENVWNARVTHCYAAGVVTCRNAAGGLVGYGDADAVMASFWDSQTSGRAESAGGEPKVTAEMQTADTFLAAGWDFVGETENGTDDIWWMPAGRGYPRLWGRRVAEDGAE